MLNPTKKRLIEVLPFGRVAGALRSEGDDEN
jgi:hypothetical protein